MNPISKQEFLEELEENYHIDVKSGDALVWVLENNPTIDKVRAMKDQLRELLPEQEHIVLGDLEALYQLDLGEEQ